MRSIVRQRRNGEVLEQHLGDFRIHQQDTETPLDIFSRSFPTFDYDPSLPPATSNANLREYEGWRRSHAESDDIWNRYQDALESERFDCVANALLHN
jgi:hypothetical protein